ncbi:MAG: FtsQ-type POTRA domain-containing protein [Caloramator sp.]|nr:FtsQ-type POTRA domain-containing protein [Caloramator sp.]
MEKNSKKYIGISFLIFFIIIFIFLIMKSSFFNIKTINVVGNYLVSTEEIIALSDTLEKNIFLISKAKIAERIMNNPYIEKVTINRKLPSTLVIRIDEKKVKGVLKLNNLFVNIDDNGRMIQALDTFPHDKVFVIEGINVKEYIPNEYVSKDKNILISLKEVLKVCEYTKELGIISVDLRDLENIKFKTNGSLIINVGDCSNLDYKLGYARTIIKNKLLKNQSGIIEITSSGIAVFKKQ